jgi:hypothetical protein
MGESMITSVVTVATAIVGVAIIAVLVSKNAQTPDVLKAAGGAFSQALRAATGPVTGSGFGAFDTGGASYSV